MASPSVIRAGSAYVELFCKKAKFEQDLKDASASFRSWGNTVASAGNAIMQSVAALAAPLGLAVSNFKTFDDNIRTTAGVLGLAYAQSSRQVNSLSEALGVSTAKIRESSVAMEQLVVQARDLGATTSFTANQISQAMAQLARAGLSLHEISDIIEPVLNLARATGTDLTNSATIAVAAMRTFGLEMSHSTRVIDLLTQTANKSPQSIEDIGHALKYAGPAAKALGVDIKTTLRDLGLLAQFNIKGEQGGSTLRNMLMRLTSKKNQETYKEVFGVDVIDKTTRQLKPLTKLFEETKIAAQRLNLSSAEVGAAFKDIFSLRALPGGFSLMNIDTSQLTSDLENAEGAAGRAAKQMDAGLGGSIRLFLSELERLGNYISSTLAPVLQTFVDAGKWIINKVVTPFVEKFGGFIKIAFGIGAVVGGIALVGVVLGQASKAMSGLVHYASKLSALTWKKTTDGVKQTAEQIRLNALNAAKEATQQLGVNMRETGDASSAVEKKFNRLYKSFNNITNGAIKFKNAINEDLKALSVLVSFLKEYDKPLNNILGQFVSLTRRVNQSAPALRKVCSLILKLGSSVKSFSLKSLKLDPDKFDRTRIALSNIITVLSVAKQSFSDVATEILKVYNNLQKAFGKYSVRTASALQTIVARLSASVIVLNDGFYKLWNILAQSQAKFDSFSKNSAPPLVAALKELKNNSTGIAKNIRDANRAVNGGIKVFKDYASSIREAAQALADYNATLLGIGIPVKAADPNTPAKPKQKRNRGPRKPKGTKTPQPTLNDVATEANDTAKALNLLVRTINKSKASIRRLVRLMTTLATKASSVQRSFKAIESSIKTLESSQKKYENILQTLVSKFAELRSNILPSARALKDIANLGKSIKSLSSMNKALDKINSLAPLITNSVNALSFSLRTLGDTFAYVNGPAQVFLATMLKIADANKKVVTSYKKFSKLKDKKDKKKENGKTPKGRDEFDARRYATEVANEEAGKPVTKTDNRGETATYNKESRFSKPGEAVSIIDQNKSFNEIDASRERQRKLEGERKRVRQERAENNRVKNESRKKMSESFVNDQRTEDLRKKSEQADDELMNLAQILDDFNNHRDRTDFDKWKAQQKAAGVTYKSGKEWKKAYKEDFKTRIAAAEEEADKLRQAYEASKHVTSPTLEGVNELYEGSASHKDAEKRKADAEKRKKRKETELYGLGELYNSAKKKAKKAEAQEQADRLSFEAIESAFNISNANEETRQKEIDKLTKKRDAAQDKRDDLNRRIAATAAQRDSIEFRDGYKPTMSSGNEKIYDQLFKAVSNKIAAGLDATKEIDAFDAFDNKMREEARNKYSALDSKVMDMTFERDLAEGERVHWDNELASVPAPGVGPTQADVDAARAKYDASKLNRKKKEKEADDYFNRAQSVNEEIKLEEDTIKTTAEEIKQGFESDSREEVNAAGQKIKVGTKHDNEEARKAEERKHEPGGEYYERDQRLAKEESDLEIAIQKEKDVQTSHQTVMEKYSGPGGDEALRKRREELRRKREARNNKPLGPDSTIPAHQVFDPTIVGMLSKFVDFSSEPVQEAMRKHYAVASKIDSADELSPGAREVLKKNLQEDALVGMLNQLNKGAFTLREGINKDDFEKALTNARDYIAADSSKFVVVPGATKDQVIDPTTGTNYNTDGRIQLEDTTTTFVNPSSPIANIVNDKQEVSNSYETLKEVQDHSKKAGKTFDESMNVVRKALLKLVPVIEKLKKLKEANRGYDEEINKTPEARNARKELENATSEIVATDAAREELRRKQDLAEKNNDLSGFYHAQMEIDANEKRAKEARARQNKAKLDLLHTSPFMDEKDVDIYAGNVLEIARTRNSAGQVYQESGVKDIKATDGMTSEETDAINRGKNMAREINAMAKSDPTVDVLNNLGSRIEEFTDDTTENIENAFGNLAKKIKNSGTSIAGFFKKVSNGVKTLGVATGLFTKGVTKFQREQAKSTASQWKAVIATKVARTAETAYTVAKGVGASVAGIAASALYSIPITAITGAVMWLADFTWGWLKGLVVKDYDKIFTAQDESNDAKQEVAGQKADDFNKRAEARKRLNELAEKESLSSAEQREAMRHIELLDGDQKGSSGYNLDSHRGLTVAKDRTTVKSDKGKSSEAQEKDATQAIKALVEANTGLEESISENKKLLEKEDDEEKKEKIEAQISKQEAQRVENRERIDEIKGINTEVTVGPHKEFISESEDTFSELYEKSKEKKEDGYTNKDIDYTDVSKAYKELVSRSNEAIATWGEEIKTALVKTELADAINDTAKKIQDATKNYEEMLYKSIRQSEREASSDAEKKTFKTYDEYLKKLTAAERLRDARIEKAKIDIKSKSQSDAEAEVNKTFQETIKGMNDAYFQEVNRKINKRVNGKESDLKFVDYAYEEGSSYRNYTMEGYENMAKRAHALAGETEISDFVGFNSEEDIDKWYETEMASIATSDFQKESEETLEKIRGLADRRLEYIAMLPAVLEAREELQARMIEQDKKDAAALNEAMKEINEEFARKRQELFDEFKREIANQSYKTLGSLIGGDAGKAYAAQAQEGSTKTKEEAREALINQALINDKTEVGKKYAELMNERSTLESGKTSQIQEIQSRNYNEQELEWLRTLDPESAKAKIETERQIEIDKIVKEFDKKIKDKDNEIDVFRSNEGKDAVKNAEASANALSENTKALEDLTRESLKEKVIDETTEGTSAKVLANNLYDARIAKLYEQKSYAQVTGDKEMEDRVKTQLQKTLKEKESYIADRESSGAERDVDVLQYRKAVSRVSNLIAIDIEIESINRIQALEDALNKAMDNCDDASAKRIRQQIKMEEDRRKKELERLQQNAAMAKFLDDMYLKTGISGKVYEDLRKPFQEKVNEIERANDTRESEEISEIEKKYEGKNDETSVKQKEQELKDVHDKYEKNRTSARNLIMGQFNEAYATRIAELESSLNSTGNRSQQTFSGQVAELASVKTKARSEADEAIALKVSGVTDEKVKETLTDEYGNVSIQAFRNAIKGSGADDKTINSIADQFKLQGAQYVTPEQLMEENLTKEQRKKAEQAGGIKKYLDKIKNGTGEEVKEYYDIWLKTFGKNSIPKDVAERMKKGSVRNSDKDYIHEAEVNATSVATRRARADEVSQDTWNQVGDLMRKAEVNRIEREYDSKVKDEQARLQKNTAINLLSGMDPNLDKAYEQTEEFRNQREKAVLSGLYQQELKRENGGKLNDEWMTDGEFDITKVPQEKIAEISGKVGEEFNKLLDETGRIDMKKLPDSLEKCIDKSIKSLEAGFKAIDMAEKTKRFAEKLEIDRSAREAFGIANDGQLSALQDQIFASKMNDKASGNGVSQMTKNLQEEEKRVRMKVLTEQYREQEEIVRQQKEAFQLAYSQGASQEKLAELKSAYEEAVGKKRQLQDELATAQDEAINKSGVQPGSANKEREKAEASSQGTFSAVEAMRGLNLNWQRDLMNKQVAALNLIEKNTRSDDDHI